LKDQASLTPVKGRALSSANSQPIESEYSPQKKASMTAQPKKKQPPMKLISSVPEDKHQFWMVYVGGMDAPKMKHSTFVEAVTQAQHLARKNRSRKVYVLESIGVFTPEWVKLREEARKAALEENKKNETQTSQK
jgi:hypothetical protein